MADLKPCQPDCPYCAAMDKGHLVDALRAEVERIKVAEGEAMLVVESQDASIAALRAERDALVDMLADAFGWEDRSYAHAVMHADHAVKNLRAEVAALKQINKDRLCITCVPLLKENNDLRAEIAALKAENQKMHHDWMADHAEMLHLKDELAAANERAGRLEAAVRWALGGPGSDFRGRNEGEGQFYWRTDLAKLAGLAWDNEAGDYREVPDAM